MIIDELRREIAVLRSQVALLEAAKAEADQATRKSDLQLAILLLCLVNQREIFAVMRRDGLEWDFLTKEEFQTRDRGDGFVDDVAKPPIPRKRAA